LNEIREMEGLCKILLHTDAAQAIGKITVDVKELGVDYLTVVGHKVIGDLDIKNSSEMLKTLFIVLWA
jgi:selenocysteine lyase